jgi:hypothetical protein
MAWTQRWFENFTGTALESLPTHSSFYVNPAGGGIRPTIDTAGTGLRNGGDNGVWLDISIAADHKIQFVLKNISTQTDVRLWVRYDVNGGASIGAAANGYVIRINHGGAGANTLMIDRWDNGVRTNMVASFTVNWANDDLVAFQAVGTTMSAWRNGSMIVGSECWTIPVPIRARTAN